MRRDASITRQKGGVGPISKRMREDASAESFRRWLATQEPDDHEAISFTSASQSSEHFGLVVDRKFDERNKRDRSIYFASRKNEGDANLYLEMIAAYAVMTCRD